MPVYFLGIGGPNFLENTGHPAYARLAEVGRQITDIVKPKAVVVFSAHWQGGANTIKINTAAEADIIYDFYGFPPHFYERKYPNRGSSEIAEKVAEKLESAGVEVERVERGLDHGVWAGFIVGECSENDLDDQNCLRLKQFWRTAFDPKKNPLNVPIVQVSLYGNDDPDKHYRIGQALEGLRDQGALIIGAGMAVHNLHDFRATMGNGPTQP